MDRVRRFPNILFAVLLASGYCCLVQSFSLLPSPTSRHSSLLDSKLPQNEWDKEHLIHGAREIHEETEEELLESEQAAAWDAHDISDPGMEAAAEIRAVMMAQEMAHKRHENALHPNSSTEDKKAADWSDEEHLIHGAVQIHEETDEEVLDSELDAAWDAHDCSDPGMEAAAEERAVMLANEMAHVLREKAIEKKKKAQGLSK